MSNVFSIAPTTIAAALVVGIAQSAMAEEPSIQTQGAIIHLADNLQEEANLGWCIDTDGREFTELLHAHSCKPTGGDVLFSFSPDSGMIESVTYAGMCMAFNAPENATNPFGLIACDEQSSNQKFAYDPATQELHLASDAEQCVIVAPTIDEAGPFQSRDLILAACDSVDAGFKEWVIKG